MQYHLDGFRTGDPAVYEGSESTEDRHTLPAEVDVLIVGCGPAGLTLAAQLARFPDIKTLVVEQREGPLLMGQADGIACRTLEMFEAFGFSSQVLQEAYWLRETAFWNPDENNRGHIIRTGRVQDVEDGLSEFPHVILNQARVHDFYLSSMRNAPTRLQPFYGRKLLSVEVSPDVALSHPVASRFEKSNAAVVGAVETVRAKYVVGCDGARSTVRKEMGRILQGDSANQAWGVMDVLAITDFPDIRLKTVIHSASDGSIIIIPREGGYLVRFYVQLDRLEKAQRVADRNITLEGLIAAAQRILRPYTLDVKETAWWSLYEIGQRLCDKFDDVPDGATHFRVPHVFIAGDACHTHSPKAGQGMNVSMQDSFNLGWKLASVLLKRCAPDLLHTYSAERQGVARELIEFDREFAQMFSATPKPPGTAGAGIDPAEFQRYFLQQSRYTAGTETRYRRSILIAEPTWQHLAEGLPIGMRFHSAPVIRLADAKPMQLGHAAKADGRWRFYLFAGSEDPTGPTSGFRRLCDYLVDAAASPISRFTPHTSVIDSVFDVRAVFQQGRHQLELAKMPGLLLPRKGRLGLRDYEKIFCADSAAAVGDVFDLRRINRDRGCIVIVRPDQFVANVLPVEARAEIGEFFDGFMLACET